VLREYLDYSLDPHPGDPIATHIAVCPHCREMLDDPTEHADQDRWRELWGLRNHLPPRADHDARTTCRPRSISSVHNHLPPRANHDAGNEDSTLDEDLRLPASIQVEGFEILGMLGRGGSGVVYKARQVKVDRLVALKLLTSGAHASQKAIARLHEESRTIARLRHPQVVAIHDVGEHLGVPYLCLELAEGGSLADRLSGQSVSSVEAVRLTVALARIVQEAHDRGVIHRDLKPANVLVASPADEPLDPARLKLTDFGLAKRLDQDSPSHASFSGMFLGTPSYMAPEQARNRQMPVGPAVDVYGLGTIL
jgi:serine/threonine protein kinase